MSTLNVANITDGTDTVETGYVVNGSAKAWVNFNGQGTIAVLDSMNVASLTDVGTGSYEVNFSNSFGSANYCSLGNGNTAATAWNRNACSYPTATSRSSLICFASNTNAKIDFLRASASASGDLA